MPPILSDASLRACVQALAPGLGSSELARIGFIPARLQARGDLSTGAALAAARAAGMAAPALAALLVRAVAALPGVRWAEAAASGHVNLRFTDAALDGVLPALRDGSVSASSPAMLTPPRLSLDRADPDFMVQYAHARCHSVLRAAACMPELGAAYAAAPGQLVAGPARALLCQLEHWLRLGQNPERLRDPAVIVLFLRELSVRFDRWWMASPERATLRLLHPGQPSRSLANINLVRATAETIRSGLELSGMGAAEELR